MKIRSITLGINWRKEGRAALERRIKSFFREANGLFAEQGFEPRTQRITLPAFFITASKDSRAVHSSIEDVSSLCKNSGIRWFCVPFHLVNQDMAEVNAVAVDIAEKYKDAFINYIVTEGTLLDRKAVFHAGSFVCAVSQLSDNGFDNFRCGVSFNCKPNGAFFPFTHHVGENGFSIALELVPLCAEAIRSRQGKLLEEIRSGIIDELLPVLKQIDMISLKVEETTGMTYYGIDASLAPHPEHPDNSVAYSVELLGVDRFGSNGTAFVTSYLTDIIESLVKRSGIRITGFNGVMYSVLEDPRLAVVNSEPGSLSIDSLLAFSTMCGCGIDMVPVPGDITEEEVASIMLDIGAIAIRLNKPLGVRLLPIPGKVAGELTDFDHDFLSNTKIQEVKYRAFPGDFFDTDRLFGYLQR
jgi:uncharacterized protein (UPF0210 family)